jgi:hypothetical protein
VVVIGAAREAASSRKLASERTLMWPGCYSKPCTAQRNLERIALDSYLAVISDRRAIRYNAQRLRSFIRETRKVQSPSPINTIIIRAGAVPQIH